MSLKVKFRDLQIREMRAATASPKAVAVSVAGFPSGLWGFLVAIETSVVT